MSKILSGDGRIHLETGLMRESLVSRKLTNRTNHDRVRPMVPDVKMIAVGGGSIMDRGADAILPLVDEIIACKDEHKMVFGVGGGARGRHTQAIGLDLGLPTGGLARIVGGAEEQNRDILQFLLAPHGGITFIKDHFQDLQLFLNGGMIPICIGQPPFHFWEPPSRDGRLPDNGPDVGLLLMGEVIGVSHMIYLKDVDGIYSEGVLQKSITTDALLKNPDLYQCPLSNEVLRTMEHMRSIDSVRLVNGLVAGNLQRALAGEDVGSLIISSRGIKT